MYCLTEELVFVPLGLGVGLCDSSCHNGLGYSSYDVGLGVGKWNVGLDDSSCDDGLGDRSCNVGLDGGNWNIGLNDSSCNGGLGGSSWSHGLSSRTWNDGLDSSRESTQVRQNALNVGLDGGNWNIGLNDSSCNGVLGGSSWDHGLSSRTWNGGLDSSRESTQVRQNALEIHLLRNKRRVESRRQAIKVARVLMIGESLTRHLVSPIFRFFDPPFVNGIFGPEVPVGTAIIASPRQLFRPQFKDTMTRVSIYKWAL